MVYHVELKSDIGGGLYLCEICYNFMIRIEKDIYSATTGGTVVLRNCISFTNSLAGFNFSPHDFRSNVYNWLIPEFLCD